MQLPDNGGPTTGDESLEGCRPDGSMRVGVVLRLRPPMPEHSNGALGVAGVVNWAERFVRLHGLPPYAFDKVFGEAESIDAVFAGALEPLVDGLLAGQNGTLFTWGAPSTGKTYALFGDNPTETSTVRGLAHIMAERLFSELERLHSHHADARPHLRTSVRASALELGGLEVVDLLSQREEYHCTSPLSRSAMLESATSLEAGSADQLCSILQLARHRLEERRRTLPEGLHRRHCAFSVTLEVEDTSCRGRASPCSGSETSIGQTAGPTVRQVGRLCLVDLAGSAEKAEQTRAACTSALADLVRVVHALTPRQAGVPIPYTASPLTQLMQDALGGNCQTVMLLTAMAGTDSASQVIVPASALQFVARVTQVVNYPAPGRRLLSINRCMVESDEAMWSARQSYALCVLGEEACFSDRVPFVDNRGHIVPPAALPSIGSARPGSSRGRSEPAVGQGALKSLSDCVDALNRCTAGAGNPEEALAQSAKAFQDDCCVVYSSANQAYYLLYKRGRRRSALNRLGITELGCGVLTVRIVAASELQFAERRTAVADEPRNSGLAAYVLARIGGEVCRTETVDGRDNQLVWNSPPLRFYVDFAEEDHAFLQLEVFKKGRQAPLASTEIAVTLLPRGRVLRRRERVVGECGEAILDIEAFFIDQPEARRLPTEAGSAAVPATLAWEHDLTVRNSAPRYLLPAAPHLQADADGRAQSSDSTVDTNLTRDLPSPSVGDAARKADADTVWKSAVEAADAALGYKAVRTVHETAADVQRGEASAEATASAREDICAPVASRLPAPPALLDLNSTGSQRDSLASAQTASRTENTATVSASPLAADDSVFDLSAGSDGMNAAFRSSLSPTASNDYQMLSPIPRSVPATTPETAAAAAAAASAASVGSSGEAYDEFTSPPLRPPTMPKLHEVDGVPCTLRATLQQKLAEMAGAVLPEATHVGPAATSTAVSNVGRSMPTTHDVMSASHSTLSPRSMAGRQTPPPSDPDAGLAKKRSRHMADRFATAQAMLEQRTQQLHKTSQRMQHALQSAARWEAAAERLNAESAEQKSIIAALERLLDLALLRQPGILDDLSGLDESSLNALGWFVKSPRDVPELLPNGSFTTQAAKSKSPHSRRRPSAGSNVDMQINGNHAGAPPFVSPDSRLSPPPPSLAGSPDVAEQSGLDPISFGADAVQRFQRGGATSSLAQGIPDAPPQHAVTSAVHSLHLLPPSPLFGTTQAGQLSPALQQGRNSGTVSGVRSGRPLADRCLMEAMPHRQGSFQPRTHLLTIAQHSRESPGRISSPPLTALPSDMVSPSPGNSAAGATAIIDAYERSVQANSPTPPVRWQTSPPIATMSSSSQGSPPVVVTSPLSSAGRKRSLGSERQGSPPVVATSPLSSAGRKRSVESERRRSPHDSGRQPRVEAASAAGGHDIATTSVGTPLQGEDQMQWRRALSPPPAPPAMQKLAQHGLIRTSALSNSGASLRRGRVPLTSPAAAIGAERGKTSPSPPQRSPQMILPSPIVKPAIGTPELGRSLTPTRRIAKTLCISAFDGLAPPSVSSSRLTTRAGSLQTLVGGDVSGSGRVASARSGDAAAGFPANMGSLATDGVATARSSPHGFEIPDTAGSAGSGESSPPPLGMAATAAMAAAAAAITLQRDSSSTSSKSTTHRNESARALRRIESVATSWAPPASSTSSFSPVSGQPSSSSYAPSRQPPHGSPVTVVGGYVTPPPFQGMPVQGRTGSPGVVAHGNPQKRAVLSGSHSGQLPVTPPRNISITPPSTPIRAGHGELRFAAACVTPVRVLPPTAPMASSRPHN